LRISAVGPLGLGFGPLTQSGLGPQISGPIILIKNIKKGNQTIKFSKYVIMLNFLV